MNILSIQSWVSLGHVGNAAAILPLQRLGHDVWAINTVAFSNHPAHGGWRGQVTAPEDVAAIVDGIGERGVFADCAAVLSGYLGAAGTGEVVLEAVAAVKAANPKAIWCCDPVMAGHRGEFYVAPGIPEFFRERALARADILCPNAAELEYLADRPADTAARARDAARRLLDLGAGLVVVTGIQSETETAMLAVGADECWRLATPRLDAPSWGAGDVFAALFLGHYLRAGAARTALSRTGSAVFALMQAAAVRGGRNLPLVAAQEDMLDPAEIFAAERFI